ncbi:MAG: hypothetical protein J5855_09560, partial [Mailhella sp.]|nr:hypothetical protein [Mailhella sp.]
YDPRPPKRTIELKALIPNRSSFVKEPPLIQRGLVSLRLARPTVNRFLPLCENFLPAPRPRQNKRRSSLRRRVFCTILLFLSSSFS